jgi:hypothetical protein
MTLFFESAVVLYQAKAQQVCNLGCPDQTKLTRGRYCNDAGIGYWRTSILEKNCDKGFMMLFLH